MYTLFYFIDALTLHFLSFYLTLNGMAPSFPKTNFSRYLHTMYVMPASSILDLISKKRLSESDRMCTLSPILILFLLCLHRNNSY